jgi:hypothetical protein
LGDRPRSSATDRYVTACKGTKKNSIVGGQATLQRNRQVRDRLQGNQEERAASQPT